jgi:cellulose synthase/poly-beta-1,6-N-acetylglucosamine synthase-like glycosyltransferase
MHSYVLLYLHFRFRKKKRNTNTKRSAQFELKDYPKVTVQLPVYNEKYVVRRLINSVLMLDYPKEKLEIQILDDSNDETSIIIQEIIRSKAREGYNIAHIRRGTRTGFKAGALQYGLEKAEGDFVAVFDADFVPPRDFLKKLMSEFQSDNVGGVQARWGHLNPDDSFLTRSQAIGLDNHFINEQELRYRAGFFINFNGTCGLWRKSAIIDAGGWSGETLAEDLDLSYRVQLKGWRIKYRGDVVVPGELPEDVDSFRIQQNRWAKGTFQVACKLLRDVLRSNLKPLAKYEALVHLTCHINFVAMLLLGLLSYPIIYFKVESLVSDAYYIFASFFTVGAFGYPLLYLFSQKLSYVDYKKRIIFIPGVIAYSMGLSVSNTQAIIEAIFNKNIVFTRTPKSGGLRHSYFLESKSLIPFLEIIFGIYIVFTLFYALFNAQYIIVPFLCAYGYGFLNLGITSLRDKFLFSKPQEVLCSSKNS